MELSSDLGLTFRPKSILQFELHKFPSMLGRYGLPYKAPNRWDFLLLYPSDLHLFDQ